MGARVYRLITKPNKGYGKKEYRPGQTMNMRQTKEYLGGVSWAVVVRLKDALLKDEHFKVSRQRIFWIRHPRFMTDFQTVNFIYQRLRWEELTRRRKRKERELYEPEYYRKELDAYLRGELATSPRSNTVSILSLGLDPFNSR